MRRTAAAAALATAVATTLTACAGTVSDSYEIKNDPGHVAHVEGSDAAYVTLTEEAARRLDIQVTTVERNGRHLAAPREAIFVDPHGIWWVYTTEEPLVYVREEIDLVEERGDLAYYRTGPREGTQVVTVGVAELAGIEDAIEH